MTAYKEILYIIGTGRSGTTLIDILLGNDVHLFSAGELNRFPKRDGVPPSRSSGTLEYEFWNTIKEEIQQKESLDKIVHFSQTFEYHSALFNLLGTSKERGIYYSYLNNFFGVLFNRIHEEVVVDSSKYPLRCYHLFKSGLPLKYCVYLKKHPVSILRSFQKKGIEQPSKNWISVNLYLMVVHLLSKWVTSYLKRQGVRVLEISIEEITNEPTRFIDKIEKEFLFDMSDLQTKLANRSPLKTHNLFDGNRIRLKQNITIDPILPPENFNWKERIVYFCNLFWWK